MASPSNTLINWLVFISLFPFKLLFLLMMTRLSEDTLAARILFPTRCLWTLGTTFVEAPSSIMSGWCLQLTATRGKWWTWLQSPQPGAYEEHSTWASGEVVRWMGKAMEKRSCWQKLSVSWAKMKCDTRIGSLSLPQTNSTIARIAGL